VARKERRATTMLGTFFMTTLQEKNEDFVSAVKPTSII
jgi:hypothetical protein